MSTNRGRGRPAIGRPITVRLDDVTLEALETEAALRGVKLSALARELLRHSANELLTAQEIVKRQSHGERVRAGRALAARQRGES